MFTQNSQIARDKYTFAVYIINTKGGSYKITYFRNARGACVKEDATEEIIHYHDMHGTLVHCEYHKIKHN